MDALKVCVSRIIASLNEGLKTSLHQSAYAAAENCLLAEEVCLGLGSEGSLQNACPRAADCQCISESHILCLAGSILMNGYQTGNALARLILASHGMTRSFGSDHGYIHILGRYDTTEVNVKAMRKHQHIARLKVGLNVFLIHSCLQFIVDQDHDDIRFFCSLSRRVYLESLRLCLCPGLRTLVEADNHVTARLLRIQGMCMSLTAVTDDCDCLAVQER